MRVSIIMPVYNTAAYVGVAVASVVSQSWRDWTLIAVDDGSTDGSPEIIEGFGDPRIRLLRAAHGGVSAARNLGVAAADGDAVLFLDSDDWLCPGGLERLVRKLAEHKEASAAYGPFGFVPEAAVPGDAPTSVHPGPRRDGDIVGDVLRFCPFVMGCVLIRRDALTRAGQFRTNLHFGEDWEFWVRLALTGPFRREMGGAPVTLNRRRAGSAYMTLASDPTVIAASTAAIFDNPALATHLGARRLAALRREADAESQWAIGREMIRNGRLPDGRIWLRRSLRTSPNALRLLAALVSHVAPALLPRVSRQFLPYETPGD